MAKARPPRRRFPWWSYALLGGLLGGAAYAAGWLAPWQAVLAHLAHLSLVTGALFVFDKRRSRGDGRRVREATLLGLAIAGGALGALLAMRGVRHKTKTSRFVWLVPLALGAQVAFVLWLGFR